MTVESARRRTRKPKLVSESLVIGEMDQTVFACPDCARPLVLGARRCPGCGTHLILGVQARRASILVGAGLFAGLALSGLFAVASSAIGGTSGAPAAIASAQPSASTSAAPTAGPSTATAGPTATSSVPALSRSALVQATAVDARLLTSSAALAAALAASRFDAFGVSQLLRATSADAITGLQLSTHIGAWSGGKELSAELALFYTLVRETAADGLAASIRNEKAYRSAGQKMVTVLAGVATLDGHLRDVGGQAGVTFPPAAVPTP